MRVVVSDFENLKSSGLEFPSILGPMPGPERDFGAEARAEGRAPSMPEGWKGGTRIAPAGGRLGRQGPAEITAHELAAWKGRVRYDILTGTADRYRLAAGKLNLPCLPGRIADGELGLQDKRNCKS